MIENADSPFYLVYLGDVGRNCATFAVFTHYVRWANDHEVRVPSLIEKRKQIDDWFSDLDRAVNVINDWRLFYAWLGRGHGWAAFTRGSAAEIVPHWLSDSTEYECIRSPGGPFVYDECDFARLPKSEITAWAEHIGTSPEGLANVRAAILASNLVVSRRSLFVK